MADSGIQRPVTLAGDEPAADAVAPRRAWGFWATLAWVACALILNEGFDPLEHALLNGTAVGKDIDRSFALGALNLVVAAAVPLVVLLLAVGIARRPLHEYFGWLRTRAGYIGLGIVLALALQVAMYGVPYLLGVLDVASAAVAQYRATQAAGLPQWVPLLLAWPSVVTAPFVEESVFRGFLWHGWAQSPLGVRGTWLLSSLAFAAWHIPKAMADPNAFNGGFMLMEVLLLGLLLGWLRWRSGGTTATIIAHATFNLVPPVTTLVMGTLLAGQAMVG